jgi:hypothetical protein
MFRVVEHISYDGYSTEGSNVSQEPNEHEVIYRAPRAEWLGRERQRIREDRRREWVIEAALAGVFLLAVCGILALILR